MALVIEDGSGVTGATSFNTVTECSAHAVDYFGASLSGNEADKEAALRRAFLYMSALPWEDDLWPTFGGEIPEKVKLAQSIFARAEFKNVGYLSPEVTKAGQKVLTGVDGIQWEVIGKGGTTEDNRPIVTMAFDALRGYLKTDYGRTSSTSWVLRA